MTKVVLVSYLNTIPFVRGLENEKEFELIRKTPALCAEAFKNGECDIALLPVGALHELKDYRIVTDYCIGCTGAVRTVCLFSNVPPELVNMVMLDEHSRTSARLVKLILEEQWQLYPTYVDGLPSFPKSISEGEALLLIGDKVFEYEADFLYKIDLGEAWLQLTGLPFVFAVWVSRSTISTRVIKTLNNALARGIAGISTSMEVESPYNLDGYFKKYISYSLDEAKKKALQLFIHKLNDPAPVFFTSN